MATGESGPARTSSEYLIGLQEPLESCGTDSDTGCDNRLIREVQGHLSRYKPLQQRLGTDWATAPNEELSMPGRPFLIQDERPNNWASVVHKSRAGHRTKISNRDTCHRQPPSDKRRIIGPMQQPYDGSGVNSHTDHFKPGDSYHTDEDGFEQHYRDTRRGFGGQYGDVFKMTHHRDSCSDCRSGSERETEREEMSFGVYPKFGSPAISDVGRPPSGGDGRNISKRTNVRAGPLVVAGNWQGVDAGLPQKCLCGRSHPYQDISGNDEYYSRHKNDPCADVIGDRVCHPSTSESERIISGDQNAPGTDAQTRDVVRDSAACSDSLEEKLDSSQIAGRLMQIRDCIRRTEMMVSRLGKQSDPDLKQQRHRLLTLLKDLKMEETGYLSELQRVLAEREEELMLRQNSTEHTFHCESQSEDASELEFSDDASEQPEPMRVSAVASGGDACYPLNNQRPMIEQSLGHHSDTDVDGNIGGGGECGEDWWMIDRAAARPMSPSGPPYDVLDENRETLSDLLNKRSQLESDLSQRAEQLEELRQQHALLKEMLEQQQQLQLLHEGQSTVVPMCDESSPATKKKKVPTATLR